MQAAGSGGPSMSRIQHLAVAVATLALLPATADAQKSTNVNIATTISGVGPGNGVEVTDGEFLVRGDGGGEYVPLTEGRLKTVTNLLIVSQQPGSDWSLTTYDLGPSRLVQSSRKVFFDLRYKEASDGVVPDGYARFSETPALGTVAGAAVPYGRVAAHLIAKCSEASPVIDFRTMTLNQVGLCPGSLRFLDVAGQWYRLSFAPNNFAGVDQFKVTCTSVDAKGCKTWTVGPETQTSTTDPSQQGLQRLLKIDSGGAIRAVGSLYYVSFSFSLRRL
jgi:hypothetical protein